uniref:Uncharacterized protein n=1 Tax=Romanomermis culicivorax TaxID=13658 RepID=A0A915KW25_ROMCU
MRRHGFDCDPDNNLEPLIGHSLSWSFDSKFFADGWYPKVCGIFYSSDDRPLVKTRLWKLPRSNNKLASALSRGS